MFNQLKLAPKFTLLLLLIFILGSVLGGVVLSRSLQQHVEAQVAGEGLALMDSMQAVGRYTNQQVAPLLEAAMGDDQFWPETIPAYSARRVFELMNEQGKSTRDLHYTYKEAVLNPTNPDDLADDFEAELTQAMIEQPTLNQLSGFRDLANRGSVFYSALPIRIQDPSCLQCHGVPEDAPVAMLAQYGRENGFDWHLNEIIGTQIVYVPAKEVFQTAQRSFSSVIAIFIAGFAIALLCLNLLLKPLVVQPIQHLARVSQKLATDDIQSDRELQSVGTHKLSAIVKRQDELGNLGRIFQAMVNEVVTRQQRLQEQIKVLTIEIDDKKRSQQIAEITETDYFQTLKQKAQEIRDRKHQGE